MAMRVRWTDTHQTEQSGDSEPLTTGAPGSGVPAFGFWEWEPEGETVVYSPEWRRLLGLGESHPLGTSLRWWWDRMPEADRRELQSVCTACVKGESSLNAVVRVKREDSGFIRLLVRGAVVTREDGTRKLSGYAEELADSCVERGAGLCAGGGVQASLPPEDHAPPGGSADESAPAVFCLLFDRTVQARVEQEARFDEKRFSALYRLTQMQDEPEEDIVGFALERISRLTGSEHGCLFLRRVNSGYAVKNRMYWSRSVHALVDPAVLPSQRMPPEFTVGDAARKMSGPAIVNNAGGVRIFGVLPVHRYMVMPVIEDGRMICLASVCNKQAEYTSADLKRMELFIHGLLLVLHRRNRVHDLRKAKEDAELANRSKNEFLANVSHELRTPLNGVLSMLKLLQLSLLPDEQMQYVDAAEHSGRALLRILSDILDFSRMESGKMGLQIGRFDLRSTLASTMRLFADEARRKGLVTSLAIGDTLPPTLLGDDARVRQIVFNLVGNALKFTEQGGVSVECSLLPYSVGDTIWVYLAVRDSGIGIPSRAHDGVFDAFAQVDSSTTRKYTGTGLGLSIVKRLVGLMGGSLTVESETGEGTTMHCSLPFVRGEESAEGVPPRPTLQTIGLAAGQVGNRLDVLVAEDDPVSQFAVRAFLQRAGYRVVCVNNGRQALEALRVYPFDCLITDIQMPVMDGLETTRRIRQGDWEDIVPGAEILEAVGTVLPDADISRRVDIPRDLILVALTAHAMAGNREHFLRMGMDLYLSKPVIAEELFATLARIAFREHSAGG